MPEASSFGVTSGQGLPVAEAPARASTGTPRAAMAPQKGATPEQVETLDEALTRWAALLQVTCADRLAALGLDVATGPGTGASGGLGAALAAVCGAR